MSTIVHKPEIVTLGERMTLYVTTELPNPYKYHWRRNGILIPAAPSASTFTTGLLTKEELKDKFSCTVFGVTGQETSEEVSLEEEKQDALVDLEPGKLPKADG